MPSQAWSNALFALGRGGDRIGRTMLALLDARERRAERAASRRDLAEYRAGLLADRERDDARAATDLSAKLAMQGYVQPRWAPVPEPAIERPELEPEPPGIGLARGARPSPFAMGADPGAARETARADVFGGTPTAAPRGRGIGAAMRELLGGEPRLERMPEHVLTEPGYDPTQDRALQGRLEEIRLRESLRPPPAATRWETRDTQQGVVRIPPTGGEAVPVTLGGKPVMPVPRASGRDEDEGVDVVTRRAIALAAARELNELQNSTRFQYGLDPDEQEAAIARVLGAYNYASVDELAREMGSLGLPGADSLTRRRDATPETPETPDTPDTRQVITRDQADYLIEEKGWTEEEVQRHYRIEG